MHVAAHLINAPSTGRNFLVMLCAFLANHKLHLLSNINTKVWRARGGFRVYGGGMCCCMAAAAAAPGFLPLPPPPNLACPIHPSFTPLPFPPVRRVHKTTTHFVVCVSP